MPMFSKVRHLRQQITRSIKRQPNAYPSQAASGSASHDITEPIEEEQLPGDRLEHFHPTSPRQVLDGRFKTITKLGFGAGSTVWLAENLQYDKKKELSLPRYVSIKIGALDGNVARELVTCEHIAGANRDHEGLAFLRIPIDDFNLQGPSGTHTCLVYEPMRETLFRFQQRIPHGRIPLPLFKLFTYGLLQALDYLHTHCHLIHTDIKDDNIMVAIENPDVLESFVAAQTRRSPPSRKIKDMDREVFVSDDDLGPLRGTRLLPQLGDFNLAFPGLGGGQGHLSAIQSHRYRSPDVLLGTPWSFSTDIWNLGLMMWDLLENKSLFERPAGEDSEYDAQVHLAQMISLLGPPPRELVKSERLYRGHRLKHPTMNHRGKLCQNMNGFWGGPYFDENGEMIKADLLESGPELSDTVSVLEGEEKRVFLDFAGGMLEWLPEKRKTAKELLEHPFFASLYEDRARVL